MYVPLRIHSLHTTLAGVDSPDAYIERARGLGLSTLALCDVDTLDGVPGFVAAAGAAGLTPIIGAELSDPSGQPGRIVALVASSEGARNLGRLVKARQACMRAGDRGSFGLVRSVVRQSAGLVLLADHARLLYELEGRVRPDHLFAAVAPACLQGERREIGLARGAIDVALAPRADRALPSTDPSLPTCRQSCGPNSLAHSAQPSRAVTAASLVAAARATGVATLAVPDVYWALPSGAREHRARRALAYDVPANEVRRDWLADSPAHLTSFAETCAWYRGLPEVRGPWPAFSDSVPGAVARTQIVAALCADARNL